MPESGKTIARTYREEEEKQARLNSTEPTGGRAIALFNAVIGFGLSSVPGGNLDFYFPRGVSID